MRSLVLLTALAGTAVMPHNVRAANPPAIERVAVVDVQRCILETREGKRAKKDVEKALERGQAKLERKGKKLQERIDDLRAKQSMLAQAELMRRQSELMQEQQALEQLAAELQQDIAQKESVLAEKIYKKVGTIVSQMAHEEKVQVVLVRSQMTVLYAKPQLDLTNRVIVAYDRKHK